MEIMRSKLLSKFNFLRLKTEYEKKNDSYWFLLPLLGFNEPDLSSAGLSNTFLGDHNCEYQYDNCLYLFFKYQTFNYKLNSLVKNMENHPLHVFTYDCFLENGIMVVFNLGDEFIEVLETFKSGKYSEYPEEVKEMYFPKYTNTGTLTNRWKVFMKHIDMKKRIENKVGMALANDAEVWDKPSQEKEIYCYNKNYELLW